MRATKPMKQVANSKMYPTTAASAVPYTFTAK